MPLATGRLGIGAWPLAPLLTLSMITAAVLPTTARTASADASTLVATKGKKKGKGKGKKKGKGNKKGKSTATAPPEAGAEDKPTGTADAADTPQPADEAAAEAPAPAAFEVLPLEVKRKLPKGANQKLAERLKAAASSASVAGGPYSLKLQVAGSKRKFNLTLTALGRDGAVLATATDTCKDCKIDGVAERLEPLVTQVAAELDEQATPTGPGTLSIKTTPPGARIRIDDGEQGQAPQTLELEPGEHTLVIDKPGFLEHKADVVIEPGGEQNLDITLAAIPAADSGPKGPDPGKPWKIGGGVVLGLGLAGLGASVAMILVDGQPNPFKCEGDAVDFRGVCQFRYNTLTGGIIGTVGAGLGIAGGLALMIQGAKISARARGGKDQASLTLSVRF